MFKASKPLTQTAMSDSSSPPHEPETHVEPDPLIPDQPDPLQPDPPPNQPDPEPEANNNNNNNSAEEEEDEEEEEEEPEEEVAEEPQDQENPSPGMPLRIDPPIPDLHVSLPDVTLTSPSTTRAGGGGKRKKGKKGSKKVEEKLQSLRTNLRAKPFLPLKLVDFDKHEKLFKKLGLWDFAHIDFDRTVRVDLIAQLVASYQPKLRASYVNGVRILVNRAYLARAFRLPLKKEKGGGVEVDLECEVLSEEAIAFMSVFLLEWMLLHEDMWMMPKEVSDWMNVIRGGHPQKVDWAGLFWFMVEKELKQGGQLRDCYYGSHLQHLIKFQHPELFSMEEEPAVKDEEDGVDAGEEGPSTKLTLGQDDDEKEDGINGVEMMGVEKQNDSDDEVEGDKQRGWLFNGTNSLGEHFMQRCGGADNASVDKKDEEEEVEMDGDEDDEEEAEEAGNNSFHVLPNGDVLEGDGGYTGNLLEAMEGNQMGFGLQDDDMHHIASLTPTFFNSNRGKRVIEHEDHISNHSGNKRLRINDPWDDNNDKSVDFAMCMGQIQQITDRARVFYEEKEQALAQSNLTQQILLTELQKRDSMIEHLHKSKMDEVQKKDGEILRLERELYLMESVLEGYRKALKGTQKAFAEYRERAKLHEESTYKDSGCGGLMLTAVELEKLRKKQEEQYRAQCLISEMCKKSEEDIRRPFEEHVEKINLLEERLRGVESSVKEVIGLCAKKKVPQTEEQVPEATERLPIPQTEDKVLEGVEEPLTMTDTEDKVPEAVEEPLTIAETKDTVVETEDKVPEAVEEPLTIAENEDKVAESEDKVPEAVEEPLTIAETEDKVAETEDKVPEAVEEPLTIADTEERAPEVTEPLPNE